MDYGVVKAIPIGAVALSFCGFFARGLGALVEAPWVLAAKIVALFVYVGLGMVALRPRTPPRLRAAAWVGALAVYGYIVSVALTKSATGWFAAL